MALGLLAFLFGIAALIIFFSPQLAKGINTIRNSKEQAEQEKADKDLEREKQKQREDEGVFVTLGRIILGDKLLDDAKAAEEAAKQLKANEEATKKHLEAEFGDKSKVNPAFRDKLVLTDSEKARIADENADQTILVQNSLQKKKKRRSVFG